MQLWLGTAQGPNAVYCTVLYGSQHSFFPQQWFQWLVTQNMERSISVSDTGQKVRGCTKVQASHLLPLSGSRAYKFRFSWDIGTGLILNDFCLADFFFLNN